MSDRRGAGGMADLQLPGPSIRISVGIAIAEQVPWVTAIDAGRMAHIGRKLKNRLAAIADLRGPGTAMRVGLDVIGGIARLAEPILAEASFAVVQVTGLALDPARLGGGGENRAGPRDAPAIADQVRTRRDLRAIRPATELDREIGLLVDRRRNPVNAQSWRLARLHDLLVGIVPGLERRHDLATERPPKGRCLCRPGW